MLFEDQDDISLVNKIKNNDESEYALKALIERHSGLYYHMINIFSTGCLTETQREDLRRDRELEFYKIALDFDENRGNKFSTYLGTRTKFLCLTQRTKSKKAPKLVDFEKTLKEQPSYSIFDELEKQEEKQNNLLFVRETLSEFSPRAKNIFEQRYFSGGKKPKPWKDIAESIGMSTQGCINVHDRALENLKLRARKNEEQMELVL